MRGQLLISPVICILIILILFAGGVYLGSNVVKDYRSDVLARECDVLDQALALYAKSHMEIQEDSISYDADTSKLTYTKAKSYPATLKDLGVVRDEQAYFTKEIDLSKFDYTVSTDADGKTTYKLGVHMPNGYYYTSPYSGK